MSVRYQTAAAGESWTVIGRFITGRTVSCALYDAADGSSITLDSSTTAEVASTGLYRFDSDQITTDPTSLTTIVWQMTDSASGATDEGIVVVGGAIDNLDDSVADLAADVATVDGNVDAILVDTGTTLPAQITSDTDAIDSALVTIDSNVDAILVDTDTTIPGLISGLNDPTAAAVADAVWDEALSGHTTAGSAGAGLIDAVYMGEVWVDTTSGSSGTTLLRGSRQDPVDNLTDALSIASTLGIDTLHFLDAAALTPTSGNFTALVGKRLLTDFPTTFANNTASLELLSLSRFEGPWLIDMTDLQANAVQFEDCYGVRFVDDSTSEFVTSCVFRRCGVSGDLAKSATGGGNNFFVNCYQEQGSGVTNALTLKGVNLPDYFVNYNGHVLFADITSAGGSPEYDLNLNASHVVIQSSVTNATAIKLSGSSLLTDNSTGGTVTNHLAPIPSAGEVADAVWDEATAGHATAGTFGVAATDILTDTGTTIPAQITALNDLSAAEVNAEVDTALADYDAPTKAELDAAQASIEADIATVDANVDAILVDTDTTIPGLISGLNDPTVAAIASEVWQTVLSTASAGSGDAAETLRTLEKIFTNDATVVDIGGGTNQVTIFDDDGTTVLRRMNVSADGLTRDVVVGG